MVIIRQYVEADLPQMMAIWNDIVTEGMAFPEEDVLTVETARRFFADQSFTGVADMEGDIVGLYVVHPNHIGRCGHIANASYAVMPKVRGKKIGKKMVKHSLKIAKDLGFRLMQFNAVVATNEGAIHLYKKLGFTPLGVIPGGFRQKDGKYVDMIPFYKELI